MEERGILCKRKGSKDAKFMFGYLSLTIILCVFAAFAFVLHEISVLQSEAAHQFDNNLVPFRDVWRSAAAVEVFFIVQADVRFW